jgi:GMP synthase (glutamine-hydrolysing)
MWPAPRNPVDDLPMKPVLVLQHLSGDGPAYLAIWMQRHEVSFEVRNFDAGEVYPEHVDAYSALAVLGGEMSANDPLPSLRRAEVLILDAMARGRPVIGHCLGGQLMARALGVRVGPSLAPEVGWHPMKLHDHPSARQWFGEDDLGPVFQWHEEAFELPAGAVRLASSEACTHQAFATGPHLAMQFHVEMDEEKLRRWSELDSEAYRSLQQRHATVHSGPVMREGMAVHLSQQQTLADRVYGRWLAGVVDRAA